MATQISAHRIELDQEISVTMTFDIEAQDSPEAGWTITRAILMETAVWLESDQAEEAQTVCPDRTAWLAKFLANHPRELEDIEEALSEQWEADRAEALEYSSPSWRQAVMAGVD